MHDVIAAWLASPEKDQAIQDKEATGELFKLIEHRLGLKVDPANPLASVRTRTARYVLIGEFRDDLSAEPPATLQIVPRPENPGAARPGAGGRPGLRTQARRTVHDDRR